MLYDFAYRLIGDLPLGFDFIYGLFVLLFIVALVIMCLFPVIFIFKFFK